MTQANSDGIYILRLLSCFMVVLLHTAAQYFYKFNEKWSAAVFYDSFTRICVPIFIMITGYLLLDRRDNAFSLYKKRYLRILPPFIFYSLGYYFLAHRGFSGFVEKFISGPLEYHLWYLYMLCGLYFVMPFFQKIWHSSTKGEKQLLLFSWCILHSFFPALNALSIISYNPIPVFYLTATGLWGYAFLGAYLKTARQINRSSSLLLYLISSSLIWYSTTFFSHAAGLPTAPFNGNLSLPVVLAAASVFLGLRDAVINYGRAYIVELSSCSFGIYLIHPLIIFKGSHYLPKLFFTINPWALIPIFSLIVFLLSFLIIFYLKKIPFLRSYVG